MKSLNLFAWTEKELILDSDLAIWTNFVHSCSNLACIVGSVSYVICIFIIGSNKQYCLSVRLSVWHYCAFLFVIWSVSYIIISIYPHVVVDTEKAGTNCITSEFITRRVGIRISLYSLSILNSHRVFHDFQSH